jgi:hypothetical protein
MWCLAADTGGGQIVTLQVAGSSTRPQRAQHLLGADGYVVAGAHYAG